MLQTHPRTVDRVQATIREAALQPQEGRYDRDRFLDRIDGMMYGDDPEQGFIRDRVFAHPRMRIRFTAPPGFHLINGSAAVSGIGPDNTRMVFDAEPDRNKARSLADPAAYIQRGWIGQQVRLQGVDRFTVNGLNAATAATQVQLKDGGTAFARFVAIATPAAMYRFQFIAPPNARAKHDALFRDAVMSFHALSEAEAATLKPLRLRVVPVRAGDTEQGLAARQPFGERNLDMFRVLNGLRANERIEAGQRAKIVVSD
jgi:predicted Zn-dependent protease